MKLFTLFFLLVVTMFMSSTDVIATFSVAKNHAQFIRDLKAIINGIDITENLDPELFKRLGAVQPTNFSMLMNREIGRARAYDVMQYNFNDDEESSNYSHYFPECLISGRRKIGARVTTFEGAKPYSFFIKQACHCYLDFCLIDDKKTIEVLDLNTNNCIAMLQGHTDEINCIIKLSNGCLASCSEDNTIKIWDLNKKKCIATLEGHTKWIIRIIELRDGRLASCSADDTIKIWDLETKECTITFKGHTENVTCITQLSNSWLVSGSDDYRIKIWDLEAKKCIDTFWGHIDPVSSIIKLSDGRLASSSDNETIKIWDLEAKKCTATLKGHAHDILFITQLSNSCLASCSDDKTIKVWDLNTYECISTLKGHTEDVNCITQLSNGRLASCSDDKMIKVWDLYPELSLKQIAVVVHLERCSKDDRVMSLGDGWHEVLADLPDYFQKRFEQFVISWPA